MLMMIIWFAAGAVLAYIINIILSVVGTVISAVCAKIKIRNFAFVIIAALEFLLMLRFSAANILYIAVTFLIFIILNVKRKNVHKRAKEPHMAISKDFDSAESFIWGIIYYTVLAAPFVLNLNHLFGAGGINLFKFYMIAGYEITRFRLVQFTLMIFPLIWLIALVFAVYLYDKDAVYDVEKKREEEEKELRKKEEEKRRKDEQVREYVNKINPDLDLASTEQVNKNADPIKETYQEKSHQDKSNSDVGNTEQDEIKSSNDKSTEIDELESILNNL